VADLQIPPMRDRGGDREAVANVVRSAAGNRQERAAIVVAEVGEDAAIVGEQAAREAKPGDGLVEAMTRAVAGEPRDDRRERVEV